MADVRHLPPPRAETWSWQLGAACRGMDTSTFYHPDNERGPSRRRRERAAKAVCSGCPVAAQCLNWAIQTREPYGVWGGKTAEERELLLAVAAAGRSTDIAGRASAAPLQTVETTDEQIDLTHEIAQVAPQTTAELGELATTFSDVQRLDGGNETA